MPSSIENVPGISRRRFVTLLAAVALPLPHDEPVRWQGLAMGARASMTLYHPDRATALDAMASVLDEVERLERLFSLHRADSALARLNRDGVVEAVSPDFVRLFADASRISALTGGAFDVTVQPLWKLYADHFANPTADPAGPPPAAVAAARALIDYRAVLTEPGRVALGRPGMAVTLNGIAQGYITDQAAALLRNRGFEHVLLNLGESTAIGCRPDSHGWQIGISDPDDRSRILTTLTVTDGAVATSAPAGLRFGNSTPFHHLLDPHTGRSASHWASITVTAPSTTIADGLSTAFAVLPRNDMPAILKAAGATAAYLQTAVQPSGMRSDYEKLTFI